jgi:cytochrome P450
MSEFIPPYPPRFAREPTSWQRIQAARKNLIGIFSEAMFEYDFIGTRILAQHFFVCNTPETVQYVFNTRNSVFERKSYVMRRMLGPLAGDGLIISDGEIWRKRRKLVSPVIHASNLSVFAPVMADTARETAERWAKLPEGAPLDVLSEMARLTAEIICRAIFGQALGQERADEIVGGFTEFQHSATLVDFPSLLGLPEWWPRYRRRAVSRSTRRIHRALDDIIATLRQRPDQERSSFIGQLFAVRDQETGEPLSDDAIRNEATVVFLAGHETTANTLAFAWFLVSQAPDVQARLHQELDRVLGDRAPTLADVANLVYTRAIVEETLRLYPPIPILAREALAQETIQGQEIPKGALVMVVPYLLHRKRGLWDKPDHFVPERFLPGGSGVPSKWAYLPFSIGPRICAGMSFGFNEAVICLATLAQRFILKLEPGHVVAPVCQVSLRPGEALPMRLHRRERPAVAAPAVMAAGEAGVTPAEACPFHHG